MSTLTTSDWNLKGKTIIENNCFNYVGDFENNEWYLKFLVNTVNHSIKIPMPLKHLFDTYDEVRNGYVFYNLKDCLIDKNTPFFIDSSWQQFETSSICYCMLPHDVATNTMINCSSMPVITTSIVKENVNGIKVVGNSVAIRISNSALGINGAANVNLLPSLFSNYFAAHPLTIIYSLARSEIYDLENYSFNLLNANNVILCTNTTSPTEFIVRYPIEVVANTSSDFQKIIIDTALLKQDMLEIKPKVNLLQSTSSSHTSEISNLKQNMSSQEASITSLLNQNTQINTVMTNHTESIKMLTDKDSLLEASLNTNNSDIKTIKTQITSINTNITSLSQQIDSINELLNTQVQELTNLKTQNETHATKINELEQRLTALETPVTPNP